MNGKLKRMEMMEIGWKMMKKKMGKWMVRPKSRPKSAYTNHKIRKLYLNNYGLGSSSHPAVSPNTIILWDHEHKKIRVNELNENSEKSTTKVRRNSSAELTHGNAIVFEQAGSKSSLLWYIRASFVRCWQLLYRNRTCFPIRGLTNVSQPCCASHCYVESGRSIFFVL